MSPAKGSIRVKTGECPLAGEDGETSRWNLRGTSRRCPGVISYTLLCNSFHSLRVIGAYCGWLPDLQGCKTQNNGQTKTFTTTTAEQVLIVARSRL